MTFFNLLSTGFGGAAGTIQTSEMELFVKLVNGSRPLTIFVESVILNV